MRSKRVWIIATVLLIALICFALLRSRTAPRFKAGRFKAGMIGTNTVSYDFLAPAPFDGGKMWVWAWGVSNNRTFLFDIERREILGEILNGGPAFLDGKNLKLVCSQPGGASKSLKHMFIRTLNRLTGNQAQSQAWLMEPQTYWLLDLQNNATIRLGELPQYPNNPYVPSPDLRYGFVGILRGPQMEFYCFDLQAAGIRPLPSLGWPCGWWDSNTLLFLSLNNDFVTFDLTTGKVTSVLSSKQVAAFFRDNSISDNPAKARTFTVWTAHGFDFYLTDTNEKWKANESYLIKVERPDAKLRLIARQFKCGWSDSLDPSGRYYLYSGREAGAASNGVFLRDLKEGTTRTLVEPTSEKYFSIPRFYGDSVIYLRSNAVWKINLDGRHNIRLFPPGRP